MTFRKIPATDSKFIKFYQKYKVMLDEFENFVHLSTIETTKVRSNKAGSYAKYIARTLIISSEIFEVEIDTNDYKSMIIYLNRLREEPGFKEYNVNESRFPNAAINLFIKFINDNHYISNIIKEEKDYENYSDEELYSEVNVESVYEGAKVEYYVSKYERNSKLRLKAIELYGLDCSACGINLEEVYGDLGKGFIEIHHIKPLYSLDEETEVNPQTDLLPLCPNCHRMIHRKRDKILSVDELRKIIFE